jgi:hypothetical protein
MKKELVLRYGKDKFKTRNKMNIRALVSLNHKDKTIEIGEIIELEDEVAAKKLIETKAVEEVKDMTSINKTTGETK